MLERVPFQRVQTSNAQRLFLEKYMYFGGTCEVTRIADGC